MTASQQNTQSNPEDGSPSVVDGFDTSPFRRSTGGADPFIVEKAWEFAGIMHRNQKMPGSDTPYCVHLGLVLAELSLSLLAEPLSERESRLAMAVCVLHDCAEDCAVPIAALAAVFGPDVASAVAALSKAPGLLKKDAITDSISRIIPLEQWVWRVKLADRSVNMRKPPENWGPAKILAYADGAREILGSLGDASAFLSSRILQRIEEYPTAETRAKPCHGR